MAEEKKDVYVITDNTEAYEDYENKQNSKMRAKEHEEKTRKPRG